MVDYLGMLERGESIDILGRDISALLRGIIDEADRKDVSLSVRDPQDGSVDLTGKGRAYSIEFVPRDLLEAAELEEILGAYERNLEFSDASERQRIERFYGGRASYFMLIKDEEGNIVGYRANRVFKLDAHTYNQFCGAAIDVEHRGHGLSSLALMMAYAASPADFLGVRTRNEIVKASFRSLGEKIGYHAYPDGTRVPHEIGRVIDEYYFNGEGISPEVDMTTLVWKGCYGHKESLGGADAQLIYLADPSRTRA